MPPSPIHFNVGASPARNMFDDQSKIVSLLNGIGEGDGGPSKQLNPTLKPLTPNADIVAAITKFQRYHQQKLGRAPDGRVDPNGPTWRLMAQLSGKRSMGVEVIPSAFAGIDVSWFNDVFIKWLKDHTNLMWIGFYLPEAKYSLDGKEKSGWKGKFQRLKTMGWFGVAPIYFGMQPKDARNRSGKENLAEIGKRDGAQAAALAGAEGIPKDSTIFCDREGGDDIPQWMDYYAGWTRGLLNSGYVPGLYGSWLHVEKIAADIQGRGMRRPELWAVNIEKAVDPIQNPLKYPAPSPRNSGASSATSWQFAHAFSITWMNGYQVKVDLDSSVYSDPGRRISPLDRV